MGIPAKVCRKTLKIIVDSSQEHRQRLAGDTELGSLLSWGAHICVYKPNKTMIKVTTVKKIDQVQIDMNNDVDNIYVSYVLSLRDAVLMANEILKIAKEILPPAIPR